MPKLIVEVVADAASYFRTLEKSAKAAQVFTTETHKMGVSSRTAAQAQVAASIKGSEALRVQVRELRQVAAAAQKGSHEQVVATRLAEGAERRLATSMGVTVHEAERLRRSSRGLEAEVGRASRGALAGSGIFRSMGRSLAFASGGFLAFASAGQFIRTSVDAAREAVVTQRQLATQLRVTGVSFAAVRGRIEEANLELSHLSGFNADQLEQSLTVLVRATGRLDRALALNRVAADVARGRHISLTAAALALGKAYDGQASSLRRLGIVVPKHLKGMDAINYVAEKFAGQARAGATAQDRFAASLHNSEVIIGSALLPALNHLLVSTSNWLDRLNRSGRLQRDVAGTTKFLTDALHAARAVVGPLVAAFQGLASIMGGNRQALKLLGEAFLIFKGARLIASIGQTATSLGLIGKNAEKSAGQVKTLSGRLGTLSSQGVIPVVIAETIIQTPQYKEARKATKGFLERHGVGFLGFLTQNLNDQVKAAWQSAINVWDVWSAVFAQHAIQPTRGFEGAAGGMAAEAAAKAAHGAALVRTAVEKAVAAAPYVPTAQQRYTWFDAAIQRQLGRLTALPLQGQVAALTQIAGELQKRIDVTKDITRKLNLQDQLFNVLQQRKGLQQQVLQGVIDRLSFNVSQAALTKSLQDDLAAMFVLRDYLKKRIAAGGDTLALEQQLLANQQQIVQTEQQIAANRQAAVAARQFRRLGFDPTGQDLVPGVRRLRTELGSVSKAIEGTFLDTRHMRSLLAHVRQVLSGGLGAVGRDVRTKVQQILDGINQQLKGQQGFATRFRPATTASILAAAGLNLTPEQRRRLTVALAQTSGGRVAPRASTQFGLAGAGGVIVHGDVHVHGVQDVRGLQNQLTKQAKSQPHVRRGAR